MRTRFPITVESRLTADAGFRDDDAAMVMRANLLDEAIASNAMVVARAILVAHRGADLLRGGNSHCISVGRCRKNKDGRNCNQRRDQKSFHVSTSWLGCRKTFNTPSGSSQKH